MKADEAELGERLGPSPLPSAIELRRWLAIHGFSSLAPTIAFLVALPNQRCPHVETIGSGGTGPLSNSGPDLMVLFLYLYGFLLLAALGFLFDALFQRRFRIRATLNVAILLANSLLALGLVFVLTEVPLCQLTDSLTVIACILGGFLAGLLVNTFHVRDTRDNTLHERRRPQILSFANRNGNEPF